VTDSPCPTWVQNDRESSIVVPGVLKYFDLPDLISLMAPRPVRLSSLVDGANLVLTAVQVKDDYHQAYERYISLGAADQVQFEDDDSLGPWLLYSATQPREEA